jgi:acetyl esterase/lipase
MNLKFVPVYFLLFLLAAIGLESAHAQNQIVTYQTQENSVYRTGDNLPEDMQSRCRLDIYYPENRKGFQTVVWFHGGGLTGGEKFIPERLKNKDIAIVSVNYRLHPAVKNPAYIEDAAAAVAWVFNNIERYGGSRENIIVSGHSAGGYLAMMVGLDKRWLAGYGLDADAIRMLVPFSGHTITHMTIRKESGISDKQPVVDEFAPLWHVRRDAPPLHLITGDRELEILGRYEENAYMWRMMKVAGHDNTFLYELDGFDHGGMADPGYDLLLKIIRK